MLFSRLAVSVILPSWSRHQKCGEVGNTTVIGTQLYFTLVRQRYKHGGHIERAFERERKTCFVPFPNSDVSNDETKLQ